LKYNPRQNIPKAAITLAYMMYAFRYPMAVVVGTRLEGRAARFSQLCSKNNTSSAYSRVREAKGNQSPASTDEHEDGTTASRVCVQKIGLSCDTGSDCAREIQSMSLRVCSTQAYPRLDSLNAKYEPQ
jgi:hypothetical protein